jgi:hypothetical protein
LKQLQNLYLQSNNLKSFSLIYLSSIFLIDLSSNRIKNIEYYTSLSLLEKQASDLQVPDANGLNRFKNGILVDNFTGFSVTDALNDDYNAKINKRLTTMTAPERVLNVPLFNLNALNAYGNLSAAAEAGLSYKYHSKTGGASSVITLPYTTANLVSQKLASVAVSLNPFAVVVEFSMGSQTGKPILRIC